MAPSDALPPMSASRVDAADSAGFESVLNRARVAFKRAVALPRSLRWSSWHGLCHGRVGDGLQGPSQTAGALNASV